MSPVSKKESTEKRLIATMDRLDEHMAKVAEYHEPGRYLWMGFLRGIVYGLGILVSIAIVVPIIIQLLATIEWVPLIGDFVEDVSTRIQESANSRF